MHAHRFADIDKTIPGGTKIVIPVYAIHHDPNHYPNPDQFDPERFDEKVASTRHPLAFLAFGDGPRNCIGKNIIYFHASCSIKCETYDE